MTRLHGVRAQNMITFYEHDGAARTTNSAVVNEVIWNVYEVHATVPTYTVFIREK